LVIAEDGSAAASEARRIGAMSVDANNVDAIQVILEDLLAGRIPRTIQARETISYERLAIDMDRLLREAIDKKQTAGVHQSFADLHPMKLTADRRV